MGSTYASSIVVGTSSGDVLLALGDSFAFVSPTNDAVAVYALQDEEAIGKGVTSALLSAALDRPVLDVVVFDSDICSMQVFTGGTVQATCVGPPSAAEMYADGGPPDVDPAAFATAAVRLLGRGDEAALVAALTADEVFAEDLHAKVLLALELPAWAAGWGYRYIDSDLPELPCGPLVRVP